MSIEGRTLGPYLIAERLGRGGMAEVYRAIHTDMDREVALKLLRAEDVDWVASLRRFRREFRLLAQLKHPGILEVFDADFIDGHFFFTMELVPHPTLENVVDPSRIRHGRLPTRRALSVVGSLLDVLEAVHQAGVIHRDIKPSNVFVGPGDEAILSDFGVARAEMGTTRVTETGATIGTLLYMAPEQIDGLVVDRRSDTYSVGLVLYRIACGRLPFGEQLAEIVRAKTVGPSLEPPRVVWPEVHPAVEEVIMTACRRDAALRYPSAEAFRQSLDEAAGALSRDRVARRGGRPGAARPAGRLADEADSTPRHPARLEPTPPLAPGPGAPSPGAVVRGSAGIALAALVVGIGLGAFLARRDGPPGAPGQTASRPSRPGPAASPMVGPRPSPIVERSARPSASPRAVRRDRLLELMAHLWPGYVPSDVEVAWMEAVWGEPVGDLMLPGYPTLSYREEEEGRRRYLAVRAAMRIDRATHERLVRNGFLGPGTSHFLLGDTSALAPRENVLPPGQLLRLSRFYVLEAVEALARRRTSPASSPAAMPYQVKALVGYLCLCQPGFSASALDAATRILGSERDPVLQFLQSVQDQDRFAVQLDEVDRVITAHFRGRIPRSGARAPAPAVSARVHR